MKPDPQNPSRLAHRQCGLVPRRPAASLGQGLRSLLQGLVMAAAVVLLFAATGWLDQYSEQQHQLALARQEVAVARAFGDGLREGRAQGLHTARTAWLAAQDEHAYRCGVQP